MSNKQTLSNEKSLQLIQQMISQARSNISDNGLGWLSWGTLIFLAALSTYFLIHTASDNIYIGWNVFGIFTIIMLTYDIFKSKPKAVRTYVDDLLRLLDIGFTICLFTIIFSINFGVPANHGFGFFLMIFAFQMLVKGGAIQSKSLMIGSAVNWLGALAIFLNKTFKYDMLIMAAAVLIGYIIPGIILWKQYRKLNDKVHGI